MCFDRHPWSYLFGVPFGATRATAKTSGSCRMIDAGHEDKTGILE